MLSIKNLHVSVEGKKILQGLSLKVKSGEVHAIMGPNGSGKSTLAYALAGHPHYEVEIPKNKKQETKIMLGKNNLLEMSPDQRAQAGLFLAFQYPVTVPGVSVFNFLKTAYQHIHIPEDERKSFDLVAFKNQLEKRAKSLGLAPDILARSLNEGFSGGEKKRIEVLQMLTLKPKFAIMDETDSGLDIDSIKLAAKGISQTVKEHNTGSIIITHYQRILNYIHPTHVHVMKNGKIVTSGGLDLVEQLEKEGYKAA